MQFWIVKLLVQKISTIQGEAIMKSTFLVITALVS